MGNGSGNGSQPTVPSPIGLLAIDLPTHAGLLADGLADDLAADPIRPPS